MNLYVRSHGSAPVVRT